MVRMLIVTAYENLPTKTYSSPNAFPSSLRSKRALVQNKVDDSEAATDKDPIVSLTPNLTMSGGSRSQVSLRLKPRPKPRRRWGLDHNTAILERECGNETSVLTLTISRRKKSARNVEISG